MKEKITTAFWNEVAEPDDPYSAERCYCSGYDVYGELVQKADSLDYLYLLFKHKRPTREQRALLNVLAIAIANPGPREHSVQAAMCAGAGGSGAAASLMAAISVGAGNLGGAREVFHVMQAWECCGNDLQRWREHLSVYSEMDSSASDVRESSGDVWLPLEHPPGFAPHGLRCTQPVKQTLTQLVECYKEHRRDSHGGEHTFWLQQYREELEIVVKMPLAMTGVIAAAMLDLEFDAEQGEMLALLLRLPGAAAHALEQRERGWKSYPFHGDDLTVINDPGCNPSQKKPPKHRSQEDSDRQRKSPVGQANASGI